MTASPVHHVSLGVRDLDRSIAFYRDVLGLRRTMQSVIDSVVCEKYLRLPPGTTGRMVMMQAGGHLTGSLELVSFDPPLGDETRPKRPGDLGAWMVSFEVVGESIDVARDRLVALDIELWSDVTSVELDGFPPFKMFLIEDPDGTLVELVELPSADDIRAKRQTRDSGAGAA